MKQKMFFLAVAAVLLLIESLFYSYRYPLSPETLYLRYQEEFHTASEQILASSSTEDISIKGVRQIVYWPGPTPIIEFHTSSFGIAPSSHYKGIYYSPDDMPAAFQNSQQPLLETADGWAWNDGTDNHGSTSRIAPFWYTFEAHF